MKNQKNNNIITIHEHQHFLMSLVSFMKDIPGEEELQCCMKIMNAVLEHTNKVEMFYLFNFKPVFDFFCYYILIFSNFIIY